MSYSFTQTNTQTFTITHAKHLASKVATDLKRMQRFYGHPSDNQIRDFEAELVELLKRGYIAKIEYGFRRGDSWIEPTLRYLANEIVALGTVDDDPGRVTPGADISGASFYSFLTTTDAYGRASAEELESFSKAVPFVRPGAAEPSMAGYLVADKTYTSGGKSLNRSYLKSY